MDEAGVANGAFVLPPRTPTFLARYSRRSKLSTAFLVLVGCVAMAYAGARYFSETNGTVKKSENHAPKVFSKDEQEKVSSSVTPAEGASAPVRVGPAGSSDTFNQQDDRSIPMAPVDPALSESSPQGDLPRISEDGRQPWEVYARPFNAADTRPRLAILVTDLGASRLMTDAAVTRLPANVTLAFDVQGSAIASWCGRARQAGHEILLSVPMEPFDFPRSDPGSHTLLTSLPNTANQEKLNWALRQSAGYVGITTLTGSRFTTDSEKLRLVMQTLHDRGLMVLDAHAAPHGVVTEIAHEKHVPVSTVNVRIEDDLSPTAIDAALHQLEQAARLNGHAVGVMPPLPIVIDHLQAWLKTLPEQGIALAPVSAVVQ